VNPHDLTTSSRAKPSIEPQHMRQWKLA